MNHIKMDHIKMGHIKMDPAILRRTILICCCNLGPGPRFSLRWFSAYQYDTYQYASRHINMCHIDMEHPEMVHINTCLGISIWTISRWFEAY